MPKAEKLLYPGSKEGVMEVDIIEVCPSCGHTKVQTPNGRVEWVRAHYLLPIADDSNKDRISSKYAKVLRFTKSLPPSILVGDIDITWRYKDEKGIIAGDLLSLRTKDDVEFARAEVIWVKLTTFGKLTGEDKKAHERFETDDLLYKAYSKYYKIRVTPETPVKVIKFKLLQKEEI